MKKNEKPNIFFASPAGLMMWAAMMSALLSFSCGRKALPVPPGIYKPPAVNNLSATFESGVVALTWVVPEGVDHLNKGLSEMIVFKADQSGSCPDCPPSYAPVAAIPARGMKESDGNELLGSFELAVVGKGPFSFYVAGRSTAGVTGPASNTVSVSCPAEDR